MTHHENPGSSSKFVGASTAAAERYLWIPKAKWSRGRHFLFGWIDDVVIFDRKLVHKQNNPFT